MSDQAQGLRELVAARDGSTGVVTLENTPEVRAFLEGLADGHQDVPRVAHPTITDFGMATPNLEDWLGKGAAKLDPVTDELIMYRRLWLDLKAELEREADGTYGRKYNRLSSQFGTKGARIVLDRMDQAETLARLR